MKKNDTLYVIFKFIEGNPVLETSSSYKIEYCLNEYGQTETSESYFDTKEDLVFFFKEYLGQENFKKAYLLSTEDFNLGMDGYLDASELKSVFEKYGTEVINESKSSKSFLDKLF